MQTQLLGQSVRHSSFGKGIITDISSRFVTIDFSRGEKRFVYPDAFSSFLTLRDPEKQKEICAKHLRKIAKREEEQQIQRKEREWYARVRAMKIVSVSQAAFHLTLLDLERVIAMGTVFAGCYLSGKSKGKPRIPNRLQPNSACILTGLPEGGDEKDRRILGALMVSDDFWGDRCADGIIRGHDRYRLCLPAGYTLAYWDYFEQERQPKRWGQVPFQYISNDVVWRMLSDMAELLEGAEQGALMDEFSRYFCEINRLSVVQR